MSTIIDLITPAERHELEETVRASMNQREIDARDTGDDDEEEDDGGPAWD